MLAYTYVERGKFELQEKQKPALQDDRDAIIRVTLASICTSDLHIKHGSVPRAVFDLRRPGRGCCTCSSGHQRILSSSHDGHVQYSHPIHQPPLSALSAPSWCGRAFGDYTND